MAALHVNAGWRCALTPTWVFSLIGAI